jgi:hypothetical protein
VFRELERCRSWQAEPAARVNAWYVGQTEFRGSAYNSQSQMTKIEALEREVEKLSREELAAFREWFFEYDAEAWDREFEQDVTAGRLEKFAAEVLEEHRQGKTKEI